jgi:hypothetical protein
MARLSPQVARVNRFADRRHQTASLRRALEATTRLAEDAAEASGHSKIFNSTGEISFTDPGAKDRGPYYFTVHVSPRHKMVFGKRMKSYRLEFTGRQSEALTKLVKEQVSLGWSILAPGWGEQREAFIRRATLALQTAVNWLHVQHATDPVPGSAPAPCRMFVLCANAATTTVAHPVLGEVPCCQRCYDWHKRIGQRA